MLTEEQVVKKAVEMLNGFLADIDSMQPEQTQNINAQYLEGFFTAKRHVQELWRRRVRMNLGL